MGLDMNCAQGDEAEDDNVEFWNTLNVNKIRRQNEIARLGYMLRLYKHQTTSRVENKAFVKTSNDGKRRKRSVDTTEEEAVSSYTMEIVDTDAESNFELGTCKILEKSTDGQVIETHAYDFERNIFFEDVDVDSGSNLTATYSDEDGIEVQAKRELAPEVIQDVTVSISKSSQDVTTNATSPENVSSYIFSISDKDSSSDLELKDCRLWEKSDGEVIETHVYDFESNTLIEDKKVDSGTTLTATHTVEDGAEVGVGGTF